MTQPPFTQAQIAEMLAAQQAQAPVVELPRAVPPFAQPPPIATAPGADVFAKARNELARPMAPPPQAAAARPMVSLTGAPLTAVAAPPDRGPARILPGQSPDQALMERAARAKAALAAPGPLTPAPTAAGPAGAGAPQTDPTAALLRPGALGGARRAGLSPADRGMLGTLEGEGENENSALDAAAEPLEKARDTFAQQIDTLNDDARIGQLLYGQQIADNQKRRSQIEAEAKEAQTRADAKIGELEAQGINPNHYFQEQSTGQRILSGIAIFLGALGSGPTGAHSADLGSNKALDVINGAIARDIDAQKANLQKSFDAVRLRRDSDLKGFDAQRAMLESERESIQSGYAVATNELAKRGALYKDNAELQQHVAMGIAGLQNARDERVAKLNEQIYGVLKGGERLVAGAGGTINPAEIRKRAIDIRDKAAGNGKDISPEEAHRQAIADLYGASSGPVESYAKVPRGQLNQRGAEQLNAHEDAIRNIDKMLELRKKHGGGALLNPQDTAEGEALAARTQEKLVAALGKVNQGLLDRTAHLIPGNPLELKASGALGADEIGTRLRTARQMLHEELVQARRNASNVSPSAEEEDNPAGGKADEDEE